jgi:hypothetical protein
VRRVEKKGRIQYKKTEKSGSVFKGGRGKGTERGRRRGRKGSRVLLMGFPKNWLGGYYTGLAVVKCLNIFLLHSAFCAVDHCVAFTS